MSIKQVELMITCFQVSIHLTNYTKPGNWVDAFKVTYQTLSMANIPRSPFKTGEGYPHKGQGRNSISA